MNKNFVFDEEYYIWMLLTYIRRGMFKLREKELSQYGITPEQAGFLFCIQVIGEEATAAKISKFTIREPQSVSGMLDRMERKGLIKKVKDLDRINMIRITITDKGRQAYQQSTYRKSIHNIMSHLAVEKRAQLRSLLETLLDKVVEEMGLPNPTLPSPEVTTLSNISPNL